MLSAGLGLSTFRFHDVADERIHQSLLSMPLGVELYLPILLQRR